MTIITLRNLILSAVNLHVMIFCVQAEAGKICHVGNQVDEEGKMQWVSYNLPYDCDVILPGGFTERDLTKLNNMWTLEVVKFGNSFHETTATSDVTTPRSLLDEFSSATMSADFKADRVQSRMVNVSFNISCEAVADNTAYQPCDATLLSLLKGDAVACAATTHSENNENREECHIKLNLPEIDSGSPYRSDSRCGEGFLAPNGKIAECYPDRNIPCCSPAGWCGSSADHCNCQECIDFRTVGKTIVHSFCTNDVKDVAASLSMNLSCNMSEGLVSLPSCNETFPFSARNDGDSMTCTTSCSVYYATAGKCPLRVVIHDTLNQSDSGRQYRFFNKKMTYEEAVQTCNSVSDITHLVNIESVEEAQIVMEMMDEHKVDNFVGAWVGQIQGEDVWLFGEGLGTTYQDMTSYSQCDPSCPAVNEKREWTCLECHVLLPFICENDEK